MVWTSQHPELWIFVRNTLFSNSHSKYAQGFAVRNSMNTKQIFVQILVPNWAIDSIKVPLKRRMKGKQCCLRNFSLSSDGEILKKKQEKKKKKTGEYVEKAALAPLTLRSSIAIEKTIKTCSLIPTGIFGLQFNVPKSELAHVTMPNQATESNRRLFKPF